MQLTFVLSEMTTQWTVMKFHLQYVPSGSFGITGDPLTFHQFSFVQKLKVLNSIFRKNTYCSFKLFIT